MYHINNSLNAAAPDYYAARAAQSRLSASKAASVHIANIHIELAERYECLIRSIVDPYDMLTIEIQET